MNDKNSTANEIASEVRGEAANCNLDDLAKEIARYLTTALGAIVEIELHGDDSETVDRCRLAIAEALCDLRVLRRVFAKPQRRAVAA